MPLEEESVLIGRKYIQSKLLRTIERSGDQYLEPNLGQESLSFKMQTVMETAVFPDEVSRSGSTLWEL